MRLFVLSIALLIVGVLGAHISKRISTGGLSIFWTFVPSMLSGLIWGTYVRFSKNLAVASIIFDVVYTMAYVVSFIIMGDRMNASQIVGAVLSIIGVVLLSH